MTIVTLFLLSIIVAAVIPSGMAKPFSPEMENITGLEGQQLFENRQEGERIVGGRPAKEGEVPYIISLKRFGYHYCGATYLHDSISGRDFGITAAHCIAGRNTKDLTVTAGALKLSGSETSQQTLKIRNAIIHPNYKSGARTLVNDIAILLFSGVFQQSDHVKPISLPAEPVEDGQLVDISGWGHTTENSKVSNHLKVATVSVIGNDECSAMYAEAYGSTQVIFNSTICAGEKDGGIDTCQGDSGGPLATGKQDGKVPELIGVTSWGYGCARPNFPGVYTRVSNYKTWIMKSVRANLD